MKDPSDAIKNIVQNAADNSEDRPPLKKPIGSEHLGQCENCNGNVRLIKFDDGSERKAGCRCEDIKYANEKQREINAKTFEKGSIIYGDYKKKTFDDYQAEDDLQVKALKVAKHYGEHFGQHIKNGQNVMFQGTYGTGKTHLAAAIRKAIADQNYKVLFMSLPDYIDKLKQEFKDRNQRHPISKMAQDADLLVLDDVGANRMTEFEVSELFKLVDARRGKCTVYTTNYTSKDFMKSMELHRIFSRMMENTKVVVINGDDYRMKGRN